MTLIGTVNYISVAVAWSRENSSNFFRRVLTALSHKVNQRFVATLVLRMQDPATTACQRHRT